MTSVWVAEHGWCYLNAAIDCCTREITGWASMFAAARTRRSPSSTPPSRRGDPAGRADARHRQRHRVHRRAFRARLAEHGITHRRGGYRDPESQAFIESWFSKLKQRCVWREEFETLDQARDGDRRLHRPLPPPAPLRAGLPHAARGRGHLERSRRPANPSGLTVNANGVQASALPRRRTRRYSQFPQPAARPARRLSRSLTTVTIRRPERTTSRSAACSARCTRCIGTTSARVRSLTGWNSNVVALAFARGR